VQEDDRIERGEPRRIEEISVLGEGEVDLVGAGLSFQRRDGVGDGVVTVVCSKKWEGGESFVSVLASRE